jgi:hypothetical protein
MVYWEQSGLSARSLKALLWIGVGREVMTIVALGFAPVRATL